ncbi:MAG: type II secretion system protein GspL, partial [Burkholderiales bacterium]
MTRLRIFPSTSGEKFDWILLDKEGRIVREGCDGMPEAEACDVIVPAAKVLLTRAMLPKGNRNRLTELAPFAIEENVIAEPEMNHVAIGPILSDGSASLAVVDKAWLRAMLARLGSAGANPERV